MRAFTLIRASAVVLVVFFLLFEVGYCAHLYATCKGHVLKNFLDWPVCVQ